MRRTMGQACWIQPPLREANHPISPPTTKHKRLSTSMIVPAPAPGKMPLQQPPGYCAPMHTEQIRDALADALAGRQLLAHPFYRRWEAGTLVDGELAAYAEQY